MLKKSIYLLLILVSICSAYAENKVLFIGNSYTFGAGGTQSVPTIFDALAVAAGQEDPFVEMCTTGGKDYKFHYKKSQASIAQQPWTHVILQNHSTRPTHLGNIDEHIQYGTLLYDSIIESNADTQVMLYMTWARAATHPLISGESTPKSFASCDEMLGELRTGYNALAASINTAHPDRKPVVVNPVGLAWMHAGGNLPQSASGFIDLFDKDNHHGDDRGYYLSACVHYSMIYGASPEGLFAKTAVQALGLKMSAIEAAKLETTAWKTVTSVNK
jgi:hypothetical protein